MSSEKSNSKRSDSEALRKAGNEIFSQACGGCYALCVLRLKLGKALKLYVEALKAAEHNKSESASCYKNLAALNWFWGKSEWQIYMQKPGGGNEALQAMREAKQRISKSLKYYLRAFELGESGAKSEIWVTQVKETIDKCIVWVTEQVGNNSVCFEPIVVDLCAQMENAGSKSSPAGKGLAVFFNKLHVVFIINNGFKYITNGDGGEKGKFEESGYKRCLNTIKECYPPLSKAEDIVYSTNDESIKEFQSLKEQVLLLEFICESVQARCQGDAILDEPFFEDEAVSMKLVRDSIDWYRQSVLLSKGKDPESNAIAFSRIGKAYSSVSKSEKLAYRNHLESTKIAQEIMCPRIANAEWYKYSSMKVHQYQFEETINVIKMEGEKSSESFLNFIYREHSHPDPKKGEMGNIDTPPNVKAALRKAIFAYHPDNNGRFRQQWKILCEEITKVLNCKYEAFK